MTAPHVAHLMTSYRVQDCKSLYKASAQHLVLQSSWCVLQGKISREDVADLCVTLLGLPSALDTTFEIKSTIPFSQPWAPEEAAAPRDWAAELSGAGIKPGVTGKTVNGVYTGKEPEAVAAGAAAVAAGASKR